jgi:hypothetical protein
VCDNEIKCPNGQIKCENKCVVSATHSVTELTLSQGHLK